MEFFRNHIVFLEFKNNLACFSSLRKNPKRKILILSGRISHLEYLKQEVDKKIQDMLKYYEQRPEFKAAIAEHTGTPVGVAGIVTGYLFGEEPKKTVAASAAGAAGEVKREVAHGTAGEEVD